MEKLNTDVAIIGGGVTGTSILYVLSKYTNIKNITLIEKYGKIAQVQSSKNNNSQTLHFGDIETHYTVEKAKKVKAAADMVRIYVEKHGNHLFKKFSKMALAVGPDEVAKLQARQKDFSTLFPKLRLINREELSKVEPKVIAGRDPNTPLIAAFTEDGYAINYGALSQSFVDETKKINPKTKLLLNNHVTKIAKTPQGYKITTNKNVINANVLVVAASANTLTFAHKLGYGKDLIILPVAGDFFCASNWLNGKVYMMQNPKLPFAAIHGDPDVDNPNETRFGPIAKVLPILEKHNLLSFFDFLKLFQLRFDAIKSIFNILADSVYRQYVAWNFLYGIPFFGKYFFLREARKIVPTIKGKDLHYGRTIGGIRPQVVDTKTGQVALGEAKLVGDKIIFNITPSPGASVCLKNAQNDVTQIVKFLGESFIFDNNKFKEDLVSTDT
jgi:malate dehydrogenase (quinone)